MSKPTCRVDECPQPARTRGLCPKHYWKLRKYGSPTAGRERRPNVIPGSVCEADDCSRTDILARGLCVKHYSKFQTYGDPNAGIDHASPGEGLAYFYETYLTPAAHDPGWPFTSPTSHCDGYGGVWIDGQLIGVHILACTLAHGPKPSPRLEVAHSCPQNRKCFWAEHVSWKTRKANHDDKVRDDTLLYGEKHPSAVISDAAVIDIRARYAAGGITQKALAIEYGISPGHVGDLVRYRFRTRLRDQPQAPLR